MTFAQSTFSKGNVKKSLLNMKFKNLGSFFANLLIMLFISSLKQG